MPILPASTQAQPDVSPVALFVSDIHLQPSQPRTTQAFLSFLQRHAMQVQQLYILGDLFEAWAGDDDIDDPFNRQVVDAIRTVSDAGVAVFWVAGNRDFLIGAQFFEASGMQALAGPEPLEPFVANIAGRRISLVHGDAQCTDDLSYMAFRAMVRQPAWQAAFLAAPLPQRKATIENMRKHSQQEQRGKTYEIMDVHPAAIAALFEQTATTLLIHGHTHRPAQHTTIIDQTRFDRFVLPDWDAGTEPARGGWIGIDTQGVITRYGIDGAAAPEAA